MNKKMLADVLILDAILLFVGAAFGLGGFFTVLVLEIWYTLCWIADHTN